MIQFDEQLSHIVGKWVGEKPPTSDSGAVFVVFEGGFQEKTMSMGDGCHSPAVRRMDPEDLKIELKESKAMDECKVEGNIYMAVNI